MKKFIVCIRKIGSVEGTIEANSKKEILEDMVEYYDELEYRGINYGDYFELDFCEEETEDGI